MKKKVSLVLSGGGARGIAHIGVIEELERQGFEIQSIAGTSMGALVGGIYGSGKMQAYKEWIYKLNKYEVFKLIDFSLSKQGFIKGDRVFNKMKEFIPDMNIEDLKIHYTATATDILNKNEVVFTEPMFRFISPCAVVVTLWLSSNTLVPLALPCNMEISTVTASLAIIAPLASLRTA